MNPRLDRENFERVSRPLEGLAAKAPSSMSQEEAMKRLVEAQQYLRYSVSPPVAVAFVKASLGSREALLSEVSRQYLRMLVKTALPVLRRKALPPKPSGREYHLTAHEERRLVRAYRELTRFFAARTEPEISLAELNAKLEEIYPKSQFNDKTLNDAQRFDVLRSQEPGRRAMAVLSTLYPIGEKAVQRRCYEAEKAWLTRRLPTRPKIQPS